MDCRLALLRPSARPARQLFDDLPKDVRTEVCLAHCPNSFPSPVALPLLIFFPWRASLQGSLRPPSGQH